MDHFQYLLDLCHISIFSWFPVGARVTLKCVTAPCTAVLNWTLIIYMWKHHPIPVTQLSWQSLQLQPIFTPSSSSSAVFKFAAVASSFPHRLNESMSEISDLKSHKVTCKRTYKYRYLHFHFISKSMNHLQTYHNSVLLGLFVFLMEINSLHLTNSSNNKTQRSVTERK